MAWAGKFYFISFMDKEHEVYEIAEKYSCMKNI